MSLFFIVVLETPANMRFPAICKKDSSNTTKTQPLFYDALNLDVEARAHFLSFVNGFIQPERLYCIVKSIFHSNLSSKSMSTNLAAPHQSGISQRQAAIIAGVALVLMAIVAGFAYGFVFTRLVVPGNAVATSQNITNSELLFRAGIWGWLIILILDVFVAWALFIFLKPANKNLALLAAWFRLVYASLLGIAVLNLVYVLLLVHGADSMRVFEPYKLDALILFFLQAFSGFWSLGLIVFGCHLLVLGYAALRSGFIPKILGVLLIIASLCYLLTNGATLLYPNYEQYKATMETILSAPMALGELAFGVWLWAKGGKTSTVRV
jgi:hypothetical protein